MCFEVGNENLNQERLTRLRVEGEITIANGGKACICISICKNIGNFKQMSKRNLEKYGDKL